MRSQAYCLGTWKKSCCQLQQIRPAWLISVTVRFDLSFHNKSCYVPLDKKRCKLISGTARNLKKSENFIFAVCDHDPAHTAKCLKHLLFQRKWAMNFIKLLAIRRLSKTFLPAARRSTIHQGRGAGNKISGSGSGSSSRHLKFLRPALAPRSKCSLTRLQNYLVHWKLRTIVLFVELACT